MRLVNSKNNNKVQTTQTQQKKNCHYRKMSRFGPLNSKRLLILGSSVAALSVCAYSAYKYWRRRYDSIDEGFEDAPRVICLGFELC